MNFVLAAASHWPWENLVLAMLHTLWQGACVAAVLWGILRAVPARYSEFRYMSTLGALGAIVFLGMVNWSMLDRGGSIDVGPRQITSAGVSTAMDGSTISAHTEFPDSPNAGIPDRGDLQTRLRWTTLAGWVWACGAVVMLLRTAVRAARTEQWAASGTQLGDAPVVQTVRELAVVLRIRRAIRVTVHESCNVPAVMGFIWPTLLLPVSMLSELPAAQLRMILAHELAHIRRWDYLVNFWQQVVEAVLFFNPAVWWISHQARIEREACCDTMAVRITGAPTEAARTLSAFAARFAGPRLYSAAALAVTGTKSGSLLDRVKRILRPDERPSIAAPWYAAGAAILLGLLSLCALRVGAQVAVEKAQDLMSPNSLDKIEAIQKDQNPDPHTARSVEIHGTVRTSDGKTIPKSTKSVTLSVHSHSGNNTSTVSEGISINGDGSFSKKLSGFDTISVALEAKGYAPLFAGPLRVDEKGNLPEVNLLLDPGFPATIHVVDAGGKPVAGATVESAFVESFWMGEHKGKTDDEGIFTIEHSSSAVPATIDVTEPGFEFERQLVSLKKDQVATIQLSPAKLTTGTIVDLVTGDPIVGAVVKMVGRTGVADQRWLSDDTFRRPPAIKVGDNGEFSLNTLRRDGQYAFEVSASGHGSEIFQPILAGQENLTWKLGPPRVIHGRITGDLGKLSEPRSRNGPVIEAHGQAMILNEGYGSLENAPVSIIDGVGTFTVRDPIGSSVYLSAPGIPRVDIDVSNIPKLVEIHIDMPDAAKAKPSAAKRTVELSFELPKDTPAPRGNLRVYHLDPVERAYEPVEIPVENGIARYEADVPGKIGYEGRDLIGGWIEQKMDIDVIAGKEPLKISIPAVPAGAVHGRVLEPDGSGCGTFAVSPEQVVRSPLLGDRGLALQPFNADDSAGDFLLTPLPLGGRYRFVAWSQDRYVISKEVPIDAKTPIQEMTLTFAKGIPVKATVLDGDGKPRAGVNVSLDFHLNGGGGFSRNATPTDRNGAVIFEHINSDVDGQYILSIHAGSDYPGVQIPVKIDGHPVTVSLTRGVALKGRVIDEKTEKPIAMTKVHAYPVFDPSAQLRQQVETQTDADGNFIFSNLDGGKFTLSVDNTAPGGSTIEKLDNGSYQFHYPINWVNTAYTGGSEPITLRVVPYPK